MRGRRGGWFPVLVVLLVVVPLLELYVLIQVGQVIGAWWTVGLLLLISALGSWLLRREGARAWNQFRLALSSGRVPTSEVVDGALVVFGGALLLTPGFVSDIAGLLFILPPTRAVTNRLVRSRFRGLAGLTLFGVPGPVAAPRRPSRAARSDDDVVDVEVVDVTRGDGDRGR